MDDIRISDVILVHALSSGRERSCFDEDCTATCLFDLRPNQQQQTSVLSPNSPQPCVSSMTIVFPFGGVAFHEAGCGSAFLSATKNVRTQAAQLISVAYSSLSAPCLL